MQILGKTIEDNSFRDQLQQLQKEEEEEYLELCAL